MHVAGSLVGALSILVLLMLVGCVIPPSLRVEDDAGVSNSPPAIMSITGDQAPYVEPGPISIERGEMAGNVVVSLLDTDVGDTLYVRVFIDYHAPDRLPPRVGCTAVPNGKAARTATCNMSGLCATADIGVRRNMTIVVFDRLPADFGADPQAMPDGGLSTGRFYFVQCQLPQTQ